MVLHITHNFLERDNRIALLFICISDHFHHLLNEKRGNGNLYQHGIPTGLMYYNIIMNLPSLVNMALSRKHRLTMSEGPHSSSSS